MGTNICEETSNGRHERSDVIQIEEPVDNTGHNEPLADVCVANVDKLMIAHEQTKQPKADDTV